MRAAAGVSYLVDEDDPDKEYPMYPATLDHVAAYQTEARRRARFHNAAVSASAPHGSLSSSRWSLLRVGRARRPLPADS